METRLPPEPEPSLSSTSTSPPSALQDPDSTITPYSAPFTEGEDILVHLEDGLIYFGVVVEVEQEQGQCLVRFGDCTERWSSFDELRRLGGVSDDESTPPSTPAPAEPVGIEALHAQLAEIETAWQEEVKLPVHVEEARRQLNYNWDSLEWDEAHQRNSVETYCYCGERGDWYKKMLQCGDCLQWFHQECIRSLDHPLLCGDRFWAFTCTLCNGTHEETIKRLDITMVDALHLVIFNLILSKNQKFHDLETSILPFLKKKMKYLSANSATFKGHRFDLETVSKVLATNKGRFMCGSETGKQASFWGLRRLTAPWLPNKFVLQRPKYAQWKLPGPRLKETLIQPNNKKGVFHRKSGKQPNGGRRGLSKPAMKNPLKRCRPKDLLDSDSDASNYSTLDFLIKTPSDFMGPNNPFRLMGPPSSCGSRSSSIQGTPGTTTPGSLGDGHQGSPTSQATSEAESRTDLLQSVQDILNVSIKEEPTMPRLESMEPPTPGEEAASPAGDSEPSGDDDETAVFKIPGLISDFKSSLSSYFAPTSAKTRISRGDRFTVKARRLILSGDIAYLIDWESPPSSTTTTTTTTSSSSS